MRRIISLVAALALALSFPVFTLSAGAEGEWTASGAEVNGGKITSASGVATASYNGTLNLMEGAAVNFTLPSVPADADAPTQTLTFVFSSTKSDGIGLELRAAVLGDTLFNKKIRWDAYWLRGKKDDESVDSYHSETVFSYIAAADNHKVDVQYLDIEKSATAEGDEKAGAYFVTVDGITFTPKREVMGLDLSECKLELRLNFKSAATVEVSSVDKSISPVVYNGWANLGDLEEVRDNGDGTVTYLNFDKRLSSDEANDSGTYFNRSHIASAIGYDVTQPIDIQFVYDPTGGPGVWWGIGFEELPFDEITTYLMEDDKNAVLGNNTRNGFDPNDPGIMFQIAGTKAEPSRRNYESGEEGAPSDFTPIEAVEYGHLEHNGGAAYTAEQFYMIDTLHLEIGEQYSLISFNGTVLWDKYPLNRAHFKDTGLVFPYFKFIETADDRKYIDNSMTVKGINVPVAETTQLVRSKDKTGDEQIKVDNKANGTLTLLDESGNAVDTSLYTYDGTTLTLKEQLFETLAFGYHKFFASNRGGKEQIKVRYVENLQPLQTPVLTPSTFEFERNSLTQDVTFTANLKNGILTNLRGSVIARSEWSSTEEVINGDHVYTITIKKEYMNRQKASETPYRLTLVYVNENNSDDTGEAVFTFKVNAPQGTSTTEPAKKGCGNCKSSVGGSLIFGAIAFVSAGLLKRRS